MKNFNKTLAFCLFSGLAFGQNTSDYKVNIYGFARADYIFDSRQMAQSREELIDFYPLDRKLDADGKDINDAGSSNFLAVASRLGVKANGPEVWGAKPSALVEADFLGNTSGNNGMLFLRQAFLNLDWEKTSLLLGQTWYPNYIPEVAPGVVNYNSGSMFNPWGRAPQIRVTERFNKNFSGEITAYKTSSHTPYSLSTNANDASTNSLSPAFNAKIQYKNEKITAGIGAEYQSLKPLIVYNNLSTEEKVNSTMIFGYFKYSGEKFTTKTYAVSGGNMYQFMMLGGFAGYAESGGLESYKPTKTTAFWVDLSSNNPKIAPGVFFGFSKNSGVDSGFKNIYARGLTSSRSIDDLWRASARVEFKQNHLKIAPELEYTSANWGATSQDGTAAGNDFKANNLRVLVSAMYSF